jgi:hypothetical protein
MERHRLVHHARGVSRDQSRRRELGAQEWPVLAKGRVPQFDDIVYRTTFHYDPVTDAITFWYSGARYNGTQYVWSAAVERRRRSDVFAPALAATGPFPPAPAPLVEWP